MISISRRGTIYTFRFTPTIPAHLLCHAYFQLSFCDKFSPVFSILGYHALFLISKILFRLIFLLFYVGLLFLIYEFTKIKGQSFFFMTFVLWPEAILSFLKWSSQIILSVTIVLT